VLNSAPRVVWPRAYPLYALIALLFAGAAFAASVWYQASRLPDLQKFYAGTYLWLQIPLKQNVTVIEVHTPRGPLLAVDPWVRVEGKSDAQHLFITRDGMALGYDAPFLVPIRKAEPARILKFLRESIYPGSLFSVFSFSLWMGGFTFVLLLPAGIYLDWRHEQIARHGVQIRGPRLLSPRAAAKQIQGDGIALFLKK